MLAQTARQPDEHASKAVGMLVAELLVLRRMSFSVAGMLQDGRDVSLEGALVKDLGASFEQAVPEAAREACGFVAITKANSESLQHGQARVLAHSLLHAPASSIYGGTREILRGILARGLGLR
jgi:alkylation response protein AidB-like acyl-CoA dehydrogenase